MKKKLKFALRGKLTLEERLVAISYKGPGFDQIRLAAATVVLLHHCRGIEYADLKDDALSRYSGGFIDFGLLAVIVFFSISGFLVTPGLVRSGNLIDFTVNRMLRIFPGLVFVVTLTMAVVGPVLTTHSLASYFSDPSMYRYAKNALTSASHFLPGVVTENQPVIVNGSLWTLHFEVLAYVTLALSSMLGLLRRRGLFLLLFVAAYCLYIAISVIPGFATLMFDRFATFINLFVYFAAGVTICLFGDYIPFSKFCCIAAFLLILLALPFGFGPFFLPILLPYIVITSGLSALPGKSFLTWDLSYGVYLIHAVIITVLRVLFPEFRNWLLVALIVFCGALVLSYLSWTLVEGPVLQRKKLVSDWLKCQFRLQTPNQ